VAQRLSVGTLWPRHFPVDQFLARLGRPDRPVEVRSGYYQESFEARGARRARVAPEELAPLLPDLDEEARAVLGGAEVLLALDVPAGVGSLAPRLRWIHSIAAGIHHFDLAELEAAGITLTTSAGASAVAIAEFTLARILQATKALRQFDDFQADRHWAPPAEWWDLADGRLLGELTLGVVGLGAIGRAVAERAHALGMTVVANRRRRGTGPAPPSVDRLLGPDGLDEVLSGSDVVVLSLAETDATLDLIGRRELGLMRPGALLCNVARGTLVDEDALVEALVSGRLGGAVLDVTRVEPLPPESPLWTTPGVYLSPHSASAHDKMTEHTIEIFADNVRRYLDGEPLRNRVDPAAGY